MELFAQIIIFSSTVLLGIILFVREEFPQELEKDPDIDRSKIILVGLFLYNLIYLVFIIYVLNPILIERNINPIYITVVLSSINIVLFTTIVFKFRGWTIQDLGFQKPKGTIATIAISGYVVLGILRIIFRPPFYSDFLLLIIYIYTNAFTEEFVFRSIIQTQLEKVYSQNKTLIYQTLLFVLVHIPANIMRYQLDGDIGSFLLLFAFQATHGFIYGLVFMKTRSIWPPVIIHYLTNWMGPWYFTVFG